MKVNLFIVGFPKAGTTTIFNILMRSKEVTASRVKEPHHFLPEKVLNQIPQKKRKFLNRLGDPGRSAHLALVEGRKEYKDLFTKSANSGSKYFMEASSGYCIYEESLQAIRAYNDNAKIICIVRHPVDRVLSHYKMDNGHSKKRMSKSLRYIKRDFESNVKGWMLSNMYVEYSKLRKSVESIKNIYKQENILFIDFKDFKDQTKITQALSEFLKIDLDKDEIVIKNRSNPRGWKFIRRHFRYFFGRKTRYVFKTIFFSRDPKLFKYQQGTSEWLSQILKEEVEFYKLLFTDV